VVIYSAHFISDKVVSEWESNRCRCA